MALLIHTADWHLGRIFHGVHLTDEQEHLLERLVQIVDEQRPDAVLIAGDIYDRAIPPPEAVRLLDRVLCRVVGDLKVPVVMLAGNHDSNERLGFASGILAAEGLHVISRLTTEIEPVVIEDQHGPLEIFGLPYIEPAQVRALLGDDQIVGHEQAMRAMVQLARERSGGGRRVLLAHAFVSGGQLSDSERPLSVGGADTVDAGCFSGFDYVALGHLHQPQQVGPQMYYAGSLYKYSLAEAGHRKSVNLVRLGAGGLASVSQEPLTPRRDLRRLEGTLEQIIQRAPEGDPDDYLVVDLLDRGPVYDPMGKLREVYPNVLHAERRRPPELERQLHPARRQQLDDREYFSAFFKEVTDEELDEEEQAALVEVIEALESRRREAAR